MKPFKALFSILSVSQSLMILCFISAFIFSSFVPAFGTVLSQEILGFSIKWWINDGLMTFFFLLIGLELKRELKRGALSSVKKAGLPLIAAIGGVIVPALLYIAITPKPLWSGWAIPAVTDIAFSLMILQLFGSFIPSGTKIFLSAVAIADDLFAMVIIALWYNPISLSGIGIGLVLVAIAGLALLSLKKAQHPTAYLMGLFCLWLGLVYCHIHPALSGFFTALFVPVGKSLDRMEGLFHNVTWMVIVPLFTLCNAGVDLTTPLSLSYPVFVGIIVSLCIGKPLGIFLFSLLGVYGNVGSKPPQLSWFYIFLAGCFAGIGFTMSLLVTSMAFQDPNVINSAKLAIPAALMGTLLISGLALLIHRQFKKKTQPFSE